MLGRAQPSRLLTIAALALAVLGCQQRAYVASGDSGLIVDAGASDVPASPVLAISVTGCTKFDVVKQICYGSAPLTVTFAPIGSASLNTFYWMFGDQTTSHETAPTHTYTLPATQFYNVTVSGGILDVPNYSVPGSGCQVSVLPLAAGAACDVDQQCSDGLACFCRSGSGCGPAFTRGICSTICTTGFCGTGAVCANIALGAPAADGGAAAPVCLADCSSAPTSCAPGFVCERIPGGGASSTAWVSACLPLGAANDFGASCRDANGALDDAACTTGHCADIGKLGMCTVPCGAGQTCPPGGACATLPGAGTELCLPACSTTFSCTGDPALRCTAVAAADGGTDAGLTISAGASGGTYCAPD